PQAIESDKHSLRLTLDLTKKSPNQILDLIRAFDYLRLASHSLNGLNATQYKSGVSKNVAK
ncbi:MAG TPA: hypothetical protein VEC93_19685, partial [Anaerolineae bacterium]|nr:hypothetical protein [Anaerolineae bacterium]